MPAQYCTYRYYDAPDAVSYRTRYWFDWPPVFGRPGLLRAIRFCRVRRRRSRSLLVGDFEAAHLAAREGLQWAMQCQHTLGVAIVLQHFALIAALRDDAEHAARLVGFVEERFRVLSYEREYTEQWGLEKLMTAIRERLTQPEIDRLAAEGAAWTEDRAIALAMTH